MDRTAASFAMNLTPQQIKEAFPEGEEILKELLKKNRKDIKNVVQWYEEFLKEDYPTETRMFMTCFVEVCVLDSLTKKQSLIKRQLSYYKKDDNSFDIEKARMVPIESLHDFGHMRVSAKRIIVKCPFHDEKKASFVIYRDSNTYHCFSCRSGHSVIDFIIKLHRTTFKEAVRYILSAKI